MAIINFDCNSMFCSGHECSIIRSNYQNPSKMVDATAMGFLLFPIFSFEKKVSIWLMKTSFQPWKSLKAFCKMMVIIFSPMQFSKWRMQGINNSTSSNYGTVSFPSSFHCLTFSRIEIVFSTLMQVGTIDHFSLTCVPCSNIQCKIHLQAINWECSHCFST